ncbi:MAG: hypothetical protein ABI597_07810 [Gammaproteobacteria bacterium]
MNLAKDIEIKLLVECQEHIEEISKHWVPTASIERAQQNLQVSLK